MPQKIVVIGGPTATGKTAASVALAKRLGRAEIVNADSTQVYRGMDIGTAKPSLAERDGVPHHLIDVRNPDQPMTAKEFAAEADAVIAEIVSRGAVPIVVGGTGFWIRALLEGLFESPPVDPAIRARLEREAATEEGRRALHEKLLREDPAAGAAIHLNDAFRIVRALEVLEATGRTITSFRAEHGRGAGELRYDAFFAALELPRDVLYAKIDARQRTQVESGLLAEYRALMAKGYSPDLHTLNGLCYRHMRLVNDGTMTLEEAIALDQRDNRRYAKRQFTWFRGAENVHWYDSRSELPRMFDEIARFLAVA